MEKPKKERKFLKAIGRIAKTLGEELVLGIGRKYIGKVVDKIRIGKRQQMTILLALSTTLTFASIDSIPYPITGNKQRLGFNTTGNGLVWRGLASDTVTKPTNYADKNVKAYLVLDSVTGSLYIWKQGLWAAFTSSFTQPVDSLFFDTSVSPNNVDTAKMRWDYDLATVVLGMYDKVPNELGFKNFWLVKNQTGSTIAKGSVVYASGTVGASGRIAVSKFIANGTIEAKLVLGVTAHDLSNGEDGYVIDFGKIRQVNTDTFAAGAILYPSPTTAGAFTDVEPQAPNITMPIAFCINSSSNNGTIAIRVASGYKMHEIQDVDTTGIDVNGGLVYNGSYFVASNGALALQSYVDSIATDFQDSIDAITNGYYKQQFLSVTSDTLLWTKDVQLPTDENLLLAFRNGQILNNSQYTRIDTNKVKIASNSYKIGDNYTIVYVKGGGGSGTGGSSFDTTELNLQARLDLKLNISDTATMLANYATKAYADTTGRFYARQDFTNATSLTLDDWTQSDTLIAGNSTVLQVYRNGQILLPSQYTVVDTNTITIASASFKSGDNYTVIFPRGGGAGSGGGNGSLTSISAGTGITVSPDPITTSGTVSADLSVLMELTDTTLLNLTNRFNTKLNISDTTNMLSPYFKDADTTSLNLTSRFAAKQNTLTLTTTGTSGASTLVGSTLNIPQYASGSGTVTSVATGYGLSGGTITTSGTLLLDSATVFNRIRDSIVDVAIGNDTIKILKQEYPAQTLAILNWTVTSKFPIQLKAYILVFRNGQLLNNNQYDITDTAQITLVSSSFKSGANYTVATVSGIGSVSSAQGNPVYPEAGIAVSTGTTWTTSITNNSTNWNTAYTDRLKWDGGSTGLTASTGRTSLGGTTIGQNMFTLTNPSAIRFPRFNSDNTISALSDADFRTAIGTGRVTSVTAASTAGNPISITDIYTTPTIELLSATSGRNGYLTSTDWTTFNNKQNSLTNPVTGTGVSKHVPRFTGTSTLDSSIIYVSGGRVGIGIDASTESGFLTHKFVIRDNDHYFRFDGSAAGSGYRTTFSHDGTGLKIGHSSDIRDIRFTLNGLSGLTIANNGNSPVRAVGIGTDAPAYKLDVNGTFRATGAATLSSTLAVTGETTLSNLSGSGTRMVTASSTGVLSTQTIPSGGGGTVSNVTGVAPISVINNTTTPEISVASATGSVSGVVTTSAQTFAGTKTFTGNAIVNGSLTVNEDGSSVGVFRVEGDNNASLIQTAPASDFVGIGRSPENALDVQGAVRLRTLTLNGTPTRIIGADATGDVNQITLGSGLSLSSGTLSATATGTVTSVTGTAPIVSSGGTTPVISVNAATSSAAGVVSATTQSFGGNKTFTGIVGLNKVLQRPVETITVSSASITTGSTWIIVNNAGTVTLTLPSASTSTGTEYFIKTITNNTVVSASSNIVPLAGGSASTPILSGTAGKWATLVSDGTNWVIMQSN